MIVTAKGQAVQSRSEGLLRAGQLLRVSVEKLCHSSTTSNELSLRLLKKEVGLKY